MPETPEELAKIRAELESKDDATLHAIMGGQHPGRISHGIIKTILEERRANKDPIPKLIGALTDRITTIDTRLANVETVATTPWFRTFGFWGFALGLVSLIIGTAGVLRDYYGWSFPTKSGVVQSEVPMTSSNSLQQHSSPRPTAPAPAQATNATAQQAEGSTSTPPQAKTTPIPSLATPTTK